MKIKDEDLRRELQKALEGSGTVAGCARRLNINLRNFKEKLYRARIHGVEAVLHCNSPRGYDDKFKLQVVKSVAEGMPKRAAAVKYNISIGIIYSWMEKYASGGEEAVLEDNRGRPKMGRRPKPKLSDYEPGSKEYLELENEMLRRENLLLKKALPLIQESERRTLRGKRSTETSGN